MRKILFALLGVLMVAALAGAGTFAYFSDTEASTGNSFAAGTLSIAEPGSAEGSHNIDNLAPGQTETFTITVNSDGTLPLDYTVTTALSGDIMNVDEDPDTPGVQNPNAPYVSEIRINDAVTSSGSLDAASGDDPSDTVEVDITLPADAGNGYQAQSGSLDITFNATQQ